MKTAIITGASSGIGAVCTRMFLDAGWGVAALARRADLLTEVIDGHENGFALTCDVTNEDAVIDAFAKVNAKFGRVDLLFNNAGIFTPSAPVDQVTLENWQAQIDVNLTASFLCAREAFRAMKAQSPQGGRIINNGSVSAATPREGSAPYTATKHAITGLTKTIALDGRELGITCGQINIGNARTEMVQELERRTGVISPTMAVEDAANAILHMASLPKGTNVLDMTIMAAEMPFVGRG